MKHTLLSKNLADAIANGKKNSVPLVDNRPQTILQKKKMEQQNNVVESEVVQQKQNNTGLPDNLKSGIENLSGHSMDDVKVHYNSSEPAQLNAHAFAQGNQIHIAPGQEKHLPHEAWHVVQQKQGRVRATKQLKGTTSINDDAGLEKEADVMGAKAITYQRKSFYHLSKGTSNLIQRQPDIIALIAQYFGVEATTASVAAALHISPFTLTLGLIAIGTLAAAWSIHRIISYFTTPTGPERTHRNFAGHARRNSINEANLLDTIHPTGPPIPAVGLTIAQFQARFQPLVVGGQITVAQLNALLPPGHAVNFPPARGSGATEIRAGRKWTFPNPAGGQHEIWVHTNDPLHGAGSNSGTGAVVRVRSSDGRFLSDVPMAAPADLIARRDAALAKHKPTAEIDAAIAARTGQWTPHGPDRANNQHIRLV